MVSKNKANSRGFTLIELLIVIGIIGFLAAAILVAVDPIKRLQSARDARRWSEVNAILNAVLTKQLDDKAYYTGESTAPVINSANTQMIVTVDTNVVCNAVGTRPGCNAPGQTFDVAAANKNCVVNLNAIVGTWIAAMPIDPFGAGTNPCSGITCAQTGSMPLGTTAANPATGYYFHQTAAGGRIEIGACFPEQTTSITVKR